MSTADPRPTRARPEARRGGGRGGRRGELPRARTRRRTGTRGSEPRGPSRRAVRLAPWPATAPPPAGSRWSSSPAWATTRPGETLDAVAGHLVAADRAAGRRAARPGHLARRQRGALPLAVDAAPGPRPHARGGRLRDALGRHLALPRRAAAARLHALRPAAADLDAGLEALRPLRERGLRRARAAREILYAAAWLLAVPVLAATAAVCSRAARCSAAVGFDDSPILAA